MRKIIFIIFYITVFLFQMSSQEISRQNLVIGDILKIESKELNEVRTLNIYLPYEYNPDSNTVYNTIYLLDGTMNEDFLHIVGLVQFFSLQFQSPPSIVVGIANVDRKRDFTFHTDIKDLKKQFPTTGKSELFINFMEKELIPFIEKKYKVDKRRILIGQSLGGLLAIEILLKKPEMFTDYLIVSPSLWWDNESMLDDAVKLLSKNNDFSANVYISVGEEEPKIMRKEAKAIFQKLSRFHEPKLQLKFNLIKKEDHASILHNSIYQAFEWIYKLK